MSVWLVSRHPGAVAWLEQQGLPNARVVSHLDPETVQQGDCVVGTLPVHLAAEVCTRGGRYLHLALDLRAEQRGRELTREDMEACGARLVEYRVLPFDTQDASHSRACTKRTLERGDSLGKP